ncbi:hypothetical protein AVEN_271781-1 [Araneus ventricosus]|uniref:CCHC-type domain-containing protein n=1 Tax=Araneus ventricosus TaxID=182803 RepID=A0A4Y2GZR9_ARAVE|nr:hypothetical protein AVEN_271781-1 [Araneus ventricosus]
MSIFAGAKKCDLKILAEEFGEMVDDSHKLKDVKKMILASKEYDEECAKEWLNTIINERKEREENERRNEEIQMEERRRREEQEYEERKRKDEMEFELQKIRLGAEELRSFFNERVNGVKEDSFEKLSDLIITDQIKRKVSQEVKDHFIDDWSKLNSPDDLVEKLDDYDTLRSTFRSKQPRKEGHYDKRNSFKDDSAVTTNEKRKLYGVTHNEKGEPKCFDCSNFGHITRNCSLLKSVLTCREYDETDHKAINCVAKETNHSSGESLSVRRVGENSEESKSFLKKAKINNGDNVQALIDTGSSCGLLKISVAQKLKLKLERAVNKVYGFGNQKMPALTSIGRIIADIEVDNVKATFFLTMRNHLILSSDGHGLISLISLIQKWEKEFTLDTGKMNRLMKK